MGKQSLKLICHCITVQHVLDKTQPTQAFFITFNQIQRSICHTMHNHLQLTSQGGCELPFVIKG